MQETPENCVKMGVEEGAIIVISAIAIQCCYKKRMK